MVCLDPFLGDDSARVAQWCTEDGVPYVTIDAPPDSPIVKGAEAIVVGEEFATRTFGTFDPADLLDEYVRACGGLIILTMGDEGVLYRRGKGPVQRMQAFEVDALDTTGAGDSFRAGLIYALLQGAADADAVRTASAVAALVCETAPGVLSSPRPDELQRFLVGR
jgi:sugar/nucleoside kinase (ribokinase family)